MLGKHPETKELHITEQPTGQPAAESWRKPAELATPESWFERQKTSPSGEQLYPPRDMQGRQEVHNMARTNVAYSQEILITLSFSTQSLQPGLDDTRHPEKTVFLGPAFGHYVGLSAGTKFSLAG
ncbi:hypothetical protein llap_17101 [Limosa lapponica baueri]|uniref:Uncharacterized protein n=1 Tax=Limosa lapponica baueri TaxID=1758121 RepID=A0A2I0TFQ2_LIMLA|nr:hypothetical protein llap_17101 [Limosa lapponica baueri]